MTDAVLVILAGASLGFLGLGAQPPTAEWGVMIADGQPYVVNAWWICFFPGLAAVTLGLGFLLVSDGLARALRVTR
jgi:peptide/nickel transport system permease protein